MQSLNELLEQALLNGTVEELIQCTLTSEHILKIMLKTRCYSSLPLFKHLLNRSAETQELIVEMVCDDPYNMFIIDLFKEYSIIDDDIVILLSKCMPAKGIAYEHFLAVVGNGVYYGDYLYGVAQCDKAEVLPSPIYPCNLRYFGEHCSINCMKKNGYTDLNVLYYLEGALKAQNANTIKHLLELYPNEVHKQFNSCLNVYPDGLLFGLQQGLKFSEDTLEYIRREMPDLYVELEEQV